MYTTFPFFKKNLSFLLLSLNWINWIRAFVILKAYLYVFRRNILYFIRPAPNSIYNCHKLKRVKLITRLRLGVSHLREDKFKHIFQDSINPLCNGDHDIESTTLFLHWPLFVNERSTFFSTLSSLECNLLDNTDSILTQTLFFGNTSFKLNKNLKVLMATTDYILWTKRFHEPLV